MGRPPEGQPVRFMRPFVVCRLMSTGLAVQHQVVEGMVASSRRSWRCVRNSPASGPVGERIDCLCLRAQLDAAVPPAHRALAKRRPLGEVRARCAVDHYRNSGANQPLNGNAVRLRRLQPGTLHWRDQAVVLSATVDDIVGRLLSKGCRVVAGRC